MKLNNKGLAPIVIILITAVVSLGVAGGGVWYWQDQQAKKQKEDSDKKVAELQKQVDDSKKQIEELQKSSESEKTTTDDTASWKTYTNKIEGFEVKYPSSLFLYDCSDTVQPRTLFARLSVKKNDDCNAVPKGIVSYVGFSTLNKSEIDKIADSKKKIIVSGKESIQVTITEEVVGDEGEKLASKPIRTTIRTFIPYKADTYIEVYHSRISSVQNNGNGFEVGKDLTDTYNKILTTFKFTK